LRPSSWRCAYPDSAAAQPVTFRKAGMDLRGASSTSTRVGPGPASRPRRVPAGPAAGQGAARRRRRHRPQMAHTPVAVAGNRRVWSEVHAVEVALVRLSGPAVLARECPASSPRQSWFRDKRFTSGCAAGGHEAPVTGPGRHRIDRTGAHRGTRDDRRAAQRVRSFRNILLSSIPVKTGMASGHRDGVRMVPGGLR